jgi:tetratricopeptide (TPR) repeat protein
VALKEQVRTRLLDCFGWPQGQFETERAERPSAEAQPFRADVFALLQEGIECHWSADRILSDLSARMNSRVIRTRRLSRLQERLRWDESVQDFIDALDGRCTLWRALQRARTPRALAAAWVLDAARALDYREARSDEPSAADGPPEIEVEISDGRSPGGRPAKRAGPSRPSSTAPRPEAAPDGGRLAREVEETFAQLEELDYYALLGVERDAPDAAIRRAYLVAAKRYHPDALARSGLDRETRERAGKVFAAIGRAHRVLANPKRRRDYDASLEMGGTEIDAERLAAAESNYRKGEILMRQGNFRGAVEYLRPAVELWPEESAYQAALGWALFKKMPADVEGARHHLEQAHALAPDEAEVCHRLGVVLRALDELDAAEKLLDRACELDPSLG